MILGWRFACLALGSVLTLGLPPAASGTEVPVWEDYVLNCSACHGLDGAGTPGVTPTLHGLARLLEAPDGRTYLARVPGVAQAPLSDARLARVLNWVLEQYSGGAPEPPYTADEVGALRLEPLRDTVAARRALTTALSRQ
jgi:mono/diheme cytochrome c family protein